MKLAISGTVLVGALAIIGACRWYDASAYEYELKNRIPTSRIEDSKVYGVFVAEFEVSPTVVDLGDTTYKIEEAWIEHHAEPVCISAFYTIKRVLPEMALLVRVTEVARNPELAQSQIRIKKEKEREAYGDGYRNVLFSEVGIAQPSSFILRCDTRDREVVVTLKKKEPNQPLQPTAPSGRGSS